MNSHWMPEGNINSHLALSASDDQGLGVCFQISSDIFFFFVVVCQWLQPYQPTTFLPFTYFHVLSWLSPYIMLCIIIIIIGETFNPFTYLLGCLAIPSTNVEQPVISTVVLIWPFVFRKFHRNMYCHVIEEGNCSRSQKWKHLESLVSNVLNKIVWMLQLKEQSK